MTTPCAVCAAPTTTRLCQPHTRQLEIAIGNLPALIRELENAATGQTRITPATTHLAARPAETVPDHYEQRAIPAMLRSKHGRIALVTNPLPYTPAAADLHRLAIDALRQWTTAYGGPTHTHPPRPAKIYIHRNRAQLLGAEPPRPIPADRLAIWLLHHLDTITNSEHAGRIHAALTALVDTIEHTVDRHDPDLFVGRCNATTIAIAHNDDTLTPTIGDCGADLYATTGDDRVVCTRCGTSHSIGERNRDLLAAVDDQLGTVQAIADALTKRDWPINASTLRTWIQRDTKHADYLTIDTPIPGPAHDRCRHDTCQLIRHQPARPVILQRGSTVAGQRPLYRVGDVRTRLDWTRRRAEQPPELALAQK